MHARKHSRSFVSEARPEPIPDPEAEESEPEPFCMPVGVRQPHEIEFSGDLTPSAAAYISATQITCGKCKVNEGSPCLTCKRPFAHRKIAMNQPFKSVMCTNPILFSALFPNKRNFTAVPYHELIVGYSAVFVHLQDLLDPNREWLTKEWTDAARERRTWAWAAWKPWVYKHTQDVGAAFDLADPVAGRRAVIAAYQEVIVIGLRVARAKSEEDIKNGLSEEMTILNAPLHETGQAALSDVNEFNVTHFRWQTEWARDRQLKKSMEKLSV